MNRWSVQLLAVGLGWLLGPMLCPAAWQYTPGEGWQRVGDVQWHRNTAYEQLDVAREAFDKHNYDLALKAARRIVNHHLWRFSDYAPEAQYLVARCYEAKGYEEKAFDAYQKLIERHPKLDKFEEIIQRQFAIADRFLARKRFKLWGYVPWFPSMAKTIVMYQKIVKNGRYSSVAPQAQMNIGAAHENKKVFGLDAPNYAEAAKAYEVAADRYNDKPIGMEALYQAGIAYSKQARTAEYDQTVAGRAIETFTDFIQLNPEDSRVAEAQAIIDTLKTEQARGSLDIARFYEKRGRWQGALIYYNEVLLKDPGSKYAEQARLRIDAIKRRTAN